MIYLLHGKLREFPLWNRYVICFPPSTSLGGTPGVGWGFTVALTGQGGFSLDQARAFTATPGSFTFGVCATASSDARCTVDPNTVPKLMDVLTPAGVSQSDELDYTRHTLVTLQGIVISSPWLAWKEQALIYCVLRPSARSQGVGEHPYADRWADRRGR